MKNLTLSVFLSILSLTAFAGSGPGNSYSRHGIGLYHVFVTSSQHGMGQAGLAIPNGAFLNPYSPATWVFTRQTMITSNFSYSAQTEISPTTSAFFGNPSLEGMMFVFPVKKNWSFGATLTPVSTINHSIKTKVVYDGINLDIDNFGEGGLSQLSFSGGYLMMDNSAIGISIDYIFGNLKKTQLATFSATNITTTTEYQNELQGVTFSFNYFTTISNNWLSYGDKTHINVSFQAPTKLFGTTSTIKLSNLAEDSVVYSKDLTLSMPFGIKIGLAHLNTQNFIMAMDFIYQNTASLKFDTIQNDAYTNYFSIRSGIAYTPDPNPGARFEKQIQYRGGAWFTQTGMIVTGTKQDEVGLSFGMGLPLPGLRNSLDLGVSAEFKGYLYGTPYKDKVYKASIGINLGELWFQERIID